MACARCFDTSLLCSRHQFTNVDYKRAGLYISPMGLTSRAPVAIEVYFAEPPWRRRASRPGEKPRLVWPRIRLRIRLAAQKEKH